MLEKVAGANILIVDNDRLHAENMYQMLNENYEVTITYNTPEALRKIEYNHYDLVISEILMPNMSGLALTEHIRSKYTSFDLPIILFTASNYNDERSSAFIVGANDFVEKPIDIIELKSRVYSLIMLKKSIKEHLRMEAAWLQAQIRPHFLFNTL